jgi:branched-chain amino acid transport system permease protein
MPSVSANNVKLNYIEHGAGDELIVFVHGMASAIRVWSQILERLPMDYHAYALDLRGHGGSEKPGDYQLDQFAEDIYAFSRELGIRPFTYVGHSMGGKIGYQFACDHHDILKALVLVCPSPVSIVFPPDMLTAMTEQVESAFASPEGASVFFRQLTNLHDEEILDEVANDALAAGLAVISEEFNSFALSDLEPRLKGIRVPALIMAGDQDVIPVDRQRRAADGIMDCRLEVLEDAGHFIPYQSPQKFVELLTDFIKEVNTKHRLS